jgi:hypothetical protein
VVEFRAGLTEAAFRTAMRRFLRGHLPAVVQPPEHRARRREEGVPAGDAPVIDGRRARSSATSSPRGLGRPRDDHRRMTVWRPRPAH